MAEKKRLSACSLRTVLLAAALISFVHSLSADTIFSWGGDDYVTENVEFNNPAPIAPGGSGPYVSENPYSAVNPLTPTTGYSGPAVYGGYSVINHTVNRGFTEGAAHQGVRSSFSYSGNNIGDTLYLNMTPGTHSGEMTVDFAATFMFRQQDFNSDYNSGPVGIAGFSVTYMQWGGSGGLGLFAPEGRWLIETDDGYYLSQSVFNVVQSGGNATLTTQTISGADLQNTLWASYDPATDLFFDADDAVFDNLDLSNINANSLGVHFQLEDYTSISSPTIRMGVSEFSVQAIPEFSTTALIGGASALGLVLLLRRRKSAA